MEHKVERGRWERQPYAAVRTTVTMGQIGPSMGPLYGELFGWLGSKGIAPTGPPWSRYLTMGTDEVEFDVVAGICGDEEEEIVQVPGAQGSITAGTPLLGDQTV